MSALTFQPMFDKRQVDKLLSTFREKVRTKIITTLIRAGDEFVSYARQKHTYENRTGNLTSSIGYIVIEDGVVVNMSDFDAVATSDRVVLVDFTTKSVKQVKFKASIKGGDGEEGSATGYNLAMDIASGYPAGIVLIGVAGMEYGKYVEAMGFDVITGAAIHTEEFIKRDITLLLSSI